MGDEDITYTLPQKKKIAKHFVVNCPHGESKEIVKDLKKVAPSVCDDAWTREACEEYNKRRYYFIRDEEGMKAICCPHSEIRPNVYLNPTTKKAYEIEPFEQRVLNQEDASSLVASGELEDIRSAVDESLQNYLADYYEDGKGNPNTQSRGMGSVFASTQGQIAVVISYKNLNVANYWTGGWQSDYTFSSSKGKQQVEATIRVNVHYFEDGNVQLNGVFKKNASVNVSDAKGTAAAVIGTIRDLENEFQINLGKFYVEMHESTFKNLRRFLPKIGQKMDWRSSVHQLVQQAASGAT
jgi:capping protein alpha